MTKVEIQSRACGFSVIVIATEAGPKKIRLTIETDCEHVKELSSKLEFLTIKDIYGPPFGEDKVYPDKNLFDYVYRTKDLAELKGSGYAGKRNFEDKKRTGSLCCKYLQKPFYRRFCPIRKNSEPMDIFTHF